MKFWQRNAHQQDWTRYFDKPQRSRKKNLIETANKKDVSIYIDDSSETSDGIYSNFRAVVSEAELEKRLAEHKRLFLQRATLAFAIFCSSVTAVVWVGAKLKWF